MYNVPIPIGAYDIVQKRYGINKEQAYRNFFREMIYQCYNHEGVYDLTLAVISSALDKQIETKTLKDLCELGYDYKSVLYSIRSEEFTYRNPSSIHPDGWDIYTSVLYKTATENDVTAEKLDNNPIGLVFLHLIELYIERKSQPAKIPIETVERFVDEYKAEYSNGVLTFTSDTCEDVLDELLMWDVVWCQHWVYEQNGYCKTLAKLESGKSIEIIGDYIPGSFIDNNCHTHLAAVSEAGGKDYTKQQPELEFKVISQGSEDY